MALITLTTGADLFGKLNDTGTTAVAVSGLAGMDTLYGAAGNDTLYGDDGADELYGSLGANVLYGGSGNDSIAVQGGNDTVWAGAGDDLVVIDGLVAGQAAPVLQGGTGTDTLDLEGQTSGPSTIRIVTTSSGFNATIGGITMQANSFERFFTIAYQLDFIGGDEIDDIWCYDGNSRISLGGGDDSLLYHPNTTDTAAAVLDGGAGRDTLVYDLSVIATKTAIVAQGLFAAVDYGGFKGSFTGFEDVTIIGSNQHDRLDFTLAGFKVTVKELEGAGLDFDKITGGNRGDWLDGGSGRDTISGGAGDDTIRGGSGMDTLTGGSGIDTFVFTRAANSMASAMDVITDFTTALQAPGLGDKLGMHDVAVNAGLSSLTWIGQAGFTAAGQAHAVARGGAVYVEVNTQGTTGAEMVIKLENLTNAGLISAADFVF